MKTLVLHDSLVTCEDHDAVFLLAFDALKAASAVCALDAAQRGPICVYDPTIVSSPRPAAETKPCGNLHCRHRVKVRTNRAWCSDACKMAVIERRRDLAKAKIAAA